MSSQFTIVSLWWCSGNAGLALEVCDAAASLRAAKGLAVGFAGKVSRGVGLRGRTQ